MIYFITMDKAHQILTVLQIRSNTDRRDAYPAGAAAAGVVARVV
jgi:hypothetical protein